jgi:hypothetical protein
MQRPVSGRLSQDKLSSGQTYDDPEFAHALTPCGSPLSCGMALTKDTKLANTKTNERSIIAVFLFLAFSRQSSGIVSCGPPMILAILTILFSINFVGATFGEQTQNGIYHVVFFDDKTQKYRVEESRDVKGCVAWGYLENKVNETGWSQLYIHSSGDFTPHQQIYAVGAY